MHERSPKETALDTLLYERDLLRHCAKTIDAKKKRAEESNSDYDRAEYYLGIEGFLLHFRNLLGFFINKGHKPTDLTIDHPERWANGTVNATVCQRLTEDARKVNRTHGLKDGTDCYTKISWFLQHCTTYRHQQPRSWDIEKMFGDLRPVLDEFVRNFAPTTSKNDALLGQHDSRTATVTR